MIDYINTSHFIHAIENDKAAKINEKYTPHSTAEIRLTDTIGRTKNKLQENTFNMILFQNTCKLNNILFRHIHLSGNMMDNINGMVNTIMG